MNLIRFTKAIIDRMKADTAAGGLYGQVADDGRGWGPVGIITGAYTEFAPSKSATFPYVVLEISGESDDTFDEDGFRMQVRFHVFDKRESGFAACAAIIDRIHGDAAEQSNRVPSYGFHRHDLSVSQSGGGVTWGAGIMRHIRSDTAHDADTYHWIETYEVLQTTGTTES